MITQHKPEYTPFGAKPNLQVQMQRIQSLLCAALRVQPKWIPCTVSKKNPSHDLFLNFDDFSMSIEAVWKTYRTFWCRNMALKIQPEKSNLRGHSSDPLLLPREPVLQLIESLRCRANSWGNGEILERWTHAQHWSD